MDNGISSSISPRELVTGQMLDFKHHCILEFRTYAQVAKVHNNSMASCTSDAIALDILINAFKQLDKDFVAIDRLIIGGENEDWPVPQEEERDTFYDNVMN